MLAAKIARGAFYGLKVLVRPGDIQSLLKLGDLISDSAALTAAAERELKDPESATLIRARYTQPMPSLDELLLMPADSIGYALGVHLQSHKLDNYSERPLSKVSDAVYLRERQRQIHDCLHVLLGCGIEVREEACVNAFLMAKTASPISVLIVLGVILRTLMKNPREIVDDLDAIHRAWSWGRESRSPFSFRWEENLRRPLSEVRAAFQIPL